MNMDEKWLPVKGFKEYEVSNLGRVRSTFKTQAERGDDGYSYLVPHKWGQRNVFVLTRSGAKNCIEIGTLVALTFIGKKPRGTRIIHKDFDIDNCCADNLEYADAERYHQHIVERQARAGRTKTRDREAQSLEERRSRAVFLVQAVLEYESMNPKSLPTIATKYGIDPSYLSFLKNGKRAPKFFKEEYNRLVANH